MMIFSVLLGSLLVGNILKRKIPFLTNSLIPTSVLAGGLLLIVASVYRAITGEVMFDSGIFGDSGTETLEIITYHTLALGFVASAFKTTNTKLTKKERRRYSTRVLPRCPLILYKQYSVLRSQ